MNTPFVILSAELPDLNEVANLRRSEKLAHVLTVERFSFMPIILREDESSARAYLVFLPADDLDPKCCRLLELAANYGQPAILFADSAHRVVSIDADGFEVDIGTWQPCIGPDLPANYIVLPNGSAYEVRP